MWRRDKSTFAAACCRTSGGNDGAKGNFGYQYAHIAQTKVDVLSPPPRESANPAGVPDIADYVWLEKRWSCKVNPSISTAASSVTAPETRYRMCDFTTVTQEREGEVPPSNRVAGRCSGGQLAKRV